MNEDVKNENENQSKEKSQTSDQSSKELTPEKIIQNDHDLLRCTSRPTSKEECEELNIFKRLELALSAHDEMGVGLSAIQIGEPICASILVYPKDLVQEGAEGVEVKHLLNPRIVKKDNYFKFHGERCLSFPDNEANTWRYKEIEIEDEINGKLKYKGLMAVAVQHELDHFAGKIVPDMKIKPITNEAKKVGRNDPCSCGSGKKFKKCCINK